MSLIEDLFNNDLLHKSSKLVFVTYIFYIVYSLSDNLFLNFIGLFSYFVYVITLILNTLHIEKLDKKINNMVQ